MRPLSTLLNSKTAGREAETKFAMLEQFTILEPFTIPEPREILGQIHRKE